ncbi:hypothetical protein [Paracoccus albus]|uniref:hypothetical protein n=1 Tax=Paracoccus albus TaxID=3017784 RepID=UPI0022F138E3|nr:hypothetical protein [Paracoccus albus]WBU61497.1 hypothetical protein PAF20_06245 [Paracoccus albus]
MTRFNILTAALGLMLGAGASVPAFSSSEDAWAEFRATVETACAELVQAPESAGTEIEVNPFGSETYGVALISVTLDDGAVDRMVCIYDKQAKTAEITAPFEQAEQ